MLSGHFFVRHDPTRVTQDVPVRRRRNFWLVQLFILFLLGMGWFDAHSVFSHEGANSGQAVLFASVWIGMAAADSF